MQTAERNIEHGMRHEILNDFMKQKAIAPNALECAQMHVYQDHRDIRFQFAYYINMFQFYLKFHRWRLIRVDVVIWLLLWYLCVLIVAYHFFAPKNRRPITIFSSRRVQFIFTHLHAARHIVSAKWMRIDLLRSYRCSYVPLCQTKSWDRIA